MSSSSSQGGSAWRRWAQSWRVCCDPFWRTPGFPCSSCAPAPCSGWRFIRVRGPEPPCRCPPRRLRASALCSTPCSTGVCICLLLRMRLAFCRSLIAVQICSVWRRRCASRSPPSHEPRMKSARVFQLTALAMVAVSAVMVAYWMYALRSAAIERNQAARVLYSEQVAAAQALLASGVSPERVHTTLPGIVVNGEDASLAPEVDRTLAAEERRRINQFAWEGAFIERMLSDLARMEAMVTQILESVRLERGRVDLRREPVEVAGAVARVVA